MRKTFHRLLLGMMLTLGVSPVTLRAQPDIYGYLESNTYMFVRDSVRIAREMNEFRLKFSTSGDRVGLFASTNVYAAGQGIEVDLWQGYMDSYGSFFDIRIGKQVVTWGTGDGINPTDNLNPLDLRRKSPFSEPEDKKLPVNMFQGNLYLGGLRVTGIWVPDFHPFVLPDTSVWNLNIPTPSLPQMPGVIVDSYRTPDSPRDPSNTLENSEFAVKIAASLAGMDLSASYYHGWGDFPTLHQQFRLNHVDDLGRPHITAEPYLRYHRLDMIGGDVATSLFGFGLRAEGGYFITEDTDGDNPEIRDPFWHYLIGIDYTFRNGIYLNTQYVYGMFNRYGMTVPAEDNQLITLGLTYDINDYNSLELGTMYAVEDDNYLFKPGYTRTLGNAVDLTIGAYLILGNTNHHFGAFEANDQLYAEIQYNF